MDRPDQNASSSWPASPTERTPEANRSSHDHDREVSTLALSWDTLAAEDAMRTIKTERYASAWSPEEFFHSGVLDIERGLEHLRQLHALPAFGKALDFGCGIGRLTQALASRFEQVTGVDIAETMIRHARSLNRYEPRCQYVHNPHGDLRILDSSQFDFIYSNIVLQHIPPPIARVYIVEFARVLAPGGILLFQLPSHPARTLKGLLIRLIPARILNRARKGMQMHGHRLPEVRQLLESSGLQLLDAAPDHSAGPGWVSFLYCARRPR